MSIAAFAHEAGRSARLQGRDTLHMRATMHVGIQPMAARIHECFREEHQRKVKSQRLTRMAISPATFLYGPVVILCMRPIVFETMLRTLGIFEGCCSIAAECVWELYVPFPCQNTILGTLPGSCQILQLPGQYN